MTEKRHLTRRKATKALGLLALAFMIVLAVSACGSSSASPGSTTTATTTTAASGTTGSSTSGSASLTAFRNCLGQHGFAPTQAGAGAGGGFGGGGTGGSRPTRTAAQQQALSACASLRPAGGFGGAGRGGGARPGVGTHAGGGSTAFATFQTCLKQHGIQTGAAGKTSTSTKTQSAISACQKLLPNGGKASGTGTGTTTAG